MLAITNMLLKLSNYLDAVELPPMPDMHGAICAWWEGGGGGLPVPSFSVQSPGLVGRYCLLC